MVTRYASLLVLISMIVITNMGFVIIKKKKKPVAKTKVVKRVMPYYNTTLSIVIDKSEYAMQVFDADGWLVTYPVVFGNKTLADKKMEGDRCTPEGTFRIINKHKQSKWNKFILMDYPNASSYEKFYARKRTGEIPQDAKIGGNVGIHGTWPGSEYVVDNYINWTEGCISMRNEDLDELYSMLPMHTKLVIKP
jgi:murein L,D-transpeptidase YafK